ncbi:MAG: VCBS repeat-containing protein, partial [Acidobacteriota bacterium]
MSLNPRRKAGALRKHFCRFVAVVSLAALITPSAALIVTRTAQARTVAPYAAPISAPPQPFHVGTEATTSPLLAFNASVVSEVASLFAVKELPPEFAIGHLPTISDKVISASSSLLGSIVPAITSKKAPAPPTPSVGPVNFDFDNDGKADFGRWHAATNEFKVIGSTSGTLTYSVGGSSYIAAPGDYDGDGKTDAAVFNGTTWKYKTSTSQTTDTTVTFGSSGDIPVSGNYVGSSQTDMAVYRPSTGVWYMKEAVNGTVTSFGWGNSGDQPVPGDYDADGVMDFAVYRPSNGTWYIYGSTIGVYIAAWGATGDVPVPADYDGDGKTDLAVYRPTTSTWYVLKSSDSGVLTPGWGNYGDQPAPADYDGDGKADFCVWRPKTGTWYVMHSSDYSYEYAGIGVAGDTAVSSAYIQQIGASVSPDLLAAARLSPKNATGGTNLYSQNFSWGTQLVGLPGRSGLDAGFGISYNSLVWTKVGSSIVFDADTSNVSPGFRFGFPVIEPNYYDDKTGKFSYLMVTPSGGRVEFRQTAASDTYETADSSYAQLVASESLNPNDPTDGVKLIVKTTDGTQMNYEWKGGAFRCNQIKDRNGNYITIANSDEGLLQTVTDTLGRVVTVNYDSALYPTSITQTWKGTNGSGSNTTHTWATFTYTTTSGSTGDYQAINTNFLVSSVPLTVFGPANGTSLKVLQKITYPDGSSTKFGYNSYAQVVKIENYSAETTPTLLNSVSTDLDSTGSSQPDCPKFTETRNAAKNFNVVSGSEVATTTHNSLTASTSYTVGGSSVTGARIQVWLDGHPDNLRTNIFVGPSGWSEGLSIATQDCLTTSATCTTEKRWTTSSWTQDETVATYPVNPRVEETRVGDGTNTKRTTLKYAGVTSLHPASTFGLVEEAKVYDTDLSTVIKKVHTDYCDATNTTCGYSNYLSRRIIGLPTEVIAYGKNDVTNALDEVSDTTYAYDASGYTGTGQS